MKYALVPWLGIENTTMQWVGHTLLALVLLSYLQALRIDPGMVPIEWAKWVCQASMWADDD